MLKIEYSDEKKIVVLGKLLWYRRNKTCRYMSRSVLILTWTAFKCWSDPVKNASGFLRFN